MTKLARISAAFGLALLTGACSQGEVALVPVEFEGMDDQSTVLAMARGVTLGNPDAPITIAEFGDYQCPGCAGFAGNVKPQIELAYINEPEMADKVKFVFYDLPLTTIHPHAFLAARAARCAEDQGLYWEYHSSLFRNQQAWSRSPGAPLGLFEDYAAEAGLEASAFRGCLRSTEHAELVTANQQLGMMLGVSGTPTVMVSAGANMTRRLADTSFPAVREAVEALLEEMEAGESGGQ